MARRILESLEVEDKKSHGVDLRAVMGMRKGLWGSAEEIDKFIFYRREIHGMVRRFFNNPVINKS